MTLDTVLANLDRTIEGKILFSKVLVEKSPADMVSQLVKDAMVPMINLNVEELKKIREDLLKVKNGA